MVTCDVAAEGVDAVASRAGVRLVLDKGGVPVPTQPVECERDEYESSSDEDQAASDEGAVEAPAAATPAGKDAATVAAPGSSTTLEPLATPGPGVVATESD